MNQCLRITFISKNKTDILCDFVQKHAKKYDLEGMVQSLEDVHVKIIACGSRDNVEMFLDTLHKSAAEKNFEEIEVEPFLKDRDYRGVFRCIE